MKFSAKTVMKTATFRDMSLGRIQNSLVETPLSGYLNSRGKYQVQKFESFLTYCFFFVATAALLCSTCWLFNSIRKAREEMKLYDDMTAGLTTTTTTSGGANNGNSESLLVEKGNVA
jgi:hypothetical protein